MIELTTLTTSAYQLYLTLNLVYLIAAVIGLYAIAAFLSVKTKCIIIWGWWDLIVLAVPGIIFGLYLYNYLNGDTILINYNSEFNIIFYIFSAATAVFSVLANIKAKSILSVPYIIVSLLLKIVIMILIPIMIVLYVIGKRSKNSVKDNTKLITIGLLLGIGSLIKIENDHYASRMSRKGTIKNAGINRQILKRKKIL